MNARQKAKKYKKELQALSAKWKPPIELKVENYKVDTLKSDLILDERLFVAEDNKDYIKDYIKETVSNNLAQYLVEHFDEYVNYYMEHLPYALKCHIRYQIKVLRKSESEA